MLSLNRALSGVHVQSALAAGGTATLSVDGDEEGADPVVVSVALERGASDSEAPSGDWQVRECRAVSDCGRIVANVMRGFRAEGSAPPTVRELVRALSIRSRADLALQRELEQLPQQIEQLETLQAELNTKISNADFYKQAPDAVAEVLAQLQATEASLNAAYQRWDELEALQA